MSGVVVVSGANRGIGLEVVRQLADAGYTVVPRVGRNRYGRIERSPDPRRCSQRGLGCDAAGRRSDRWVLSRRQALAMVNIA